jgi:hypothetical protein
VHLVQLIEYGTIQSSDVLPSHAPGTHPNVVSKQSDIGFDRTFRVEPIDRCTQIDHDVLLQVIRIEPMISVHVTANYALDLVLMT